MWKRTAGGREFHFYLAGINNQNFLMRDRETGSWWQQVTGEAIFGPLKGLRLEPVAMDELTFALWKQEAPAGQVMQPLSKYSKEYESDWEKSVAKMPVPLDFSREGLPNREIILGVELDGTARAYPQAAVWAAWPVQDRVGGVPIVLITGPDGKSVRVFRAEVNGAAAEFFKKSDGADWSLMDSTTGSQWNFRGCATSGPAMGQCLAQVPYLKDYWFDWKNYHPATSAYKH